MENNYPPNEENELKSGQNYLAAIKKMFILKSRRRLIIFSVLIFFGIIASLAFIFRKNEKISRLEHGIFFSSSLQNFPFFQNQSFVFPAETEKITEQAPENIKTEKKKILEEAGSMPKSASSDWWLNSGGIMLFGSREFSTNTGALPDGDKWRKLYAKTNPRDTDKGYYPQNIFRLVTRAKWQNLNQVLYFNIGKINLSDSKYRNGSNGILLFNRYQDGDNLYYAGIRVDGQAVIKKKIGGEYFTLAEKEIFNNGKEYDVKNNPNIIPLNQWIGIRSELKNIGGNAASIRLYVDKYQKGDWQLILETEDKGSKHGEAPFLKKGYAGIRTDFMDVEFKGYSVERIK
jgi:hypothetical protein